ncbi:hypothetical protein Nepgr_024701 [Nepenthes gracilis]|uniref:Uncharacterized protein n=1 Tax=Nepenthes gracilis TaxID=150966 RepID=A0AAD3XZ18_NEPGR|nr:hypothetical protein Nepgr_024701 [Nepenthes gracilis]
MPGWCWDGFSPGIPQLVAFAGLALRNGSPGDLDEVALLGIPAPYLTSSQYGRPGLLLACLLLCLPLTMAVCWRGLSAWHRDFSDRYEILWPVWSLAGWGAYCTPIGRNAPVAELSKFRCAVICRNDPVADLSNCRTMLEWMSWYEGSFACIGSN